MTENVRELLVLPEADWAWLVETSRLNDPSKVLVEFWRKALGYTMNEWLELKPGSFNVADYVVTRKDHDRLYEILKRSTDGIASVMALTVLWLDIGPAPQGES